MSYLLAEWTPRQGPLGDKNRNYARAQKSVSLVG